MVPFFSVIIAAYNSEKYIKQCLDSAVKQTEKLIEIIIVDDGSVDDTKAIIDSYAKEDSRIKAIYKPKNQGKSSAIIDALEMVSGEYITLLDSDDWINEEYYSDIRKKIINSPDILIAGYISEPGEKVIYTHYQVERMISGIDLVKKNSVVHTSYDASFTCRMFFKTSLLKENHVFPDRRIVIGEDTDFNLKMLKIAKKVMAIDYAGYHYRTNDQKSLVHQPYKATLENDLIMQYPTRRNFCEDKNYLQNMATYYVDVMIFNVIKNAKQAPGGFRVADMKRILNAEWLRESYKLISFKIFAKRSYKEKILQFCMKKRLSVLCFLYYRLR